MKQHNLHALFALMTLFVATGVAGANLNRANDNAYHPSSYYLPDTVGPVHAFDVDNLLCNADFERTDYEENDSLDMPWIPEIDFCNLKELPEWKLNGQSNPWSEGYICIFKHAAGVDANKQYVRCLMGILCSDMNRVLVQKVRNIEVGATYCLDFYVRQYMLCTGDYPSLGKFEIGHAALQEEDELPIYNSDYELLPLDGKTSNTDNYTDWTYLKFEFVANSPCLGIMLSVYDYCPGFHPEFGLEHIVDFDEIRLYKIADSGIASAEHAQALAVGGRGCIAVSGLPQGAEMEVVALDGRVAYKGAAGTIPVAPGCYVVRSQGWTSKVAVR